MDIILGYFGPQRYSTKDTKKYLKVFLNYYELVKNSILSYSNDLNPTTSDKKTKTVRPYNFF